MEPSPDNFKTPSLIKSQRNFEFFSKETLSLKMASTVEAETFGKSSKGSITAVYLPNGVFRVVKCVRLR